MSRQPTPIKKFPVKFIGLKDNETAPEFAVYALSKGGQAAKKIAQYDGDNIKLDLKKHKVIALGPNVDDFANLPKTALHKYRVKDFQRIWDTRGFILPRDIWDRLWVHFHCVSGTVEKCRPWYWDFISRNRATALPTTFSATLIKPLHFDDFPHIFFPVNCEHLCEGIVEIYERECCCTFFKIPDLLDRLRDILRPIPIPLPDPIPDPFPDPLPDPIPVPIPDPFPLPGPRPIPFSIKPQLKAARRRVEKQKGSFDFSAVPPKRLYQDYLNLRTMPDKEAQAYVKARAYLFPLICSCTQRKVGETKIQEDGQFRFCYLHFGNHPFHPGRFCTRNYAYVVKQMIDGVLTVVYNGLAANEYFGAGETADIHTSNPDARSCADGPGTPPPGDGEGFVMLEYVGKHGTFHFNTPDQDGVSSTGNLTDNSGTYSVSGGASDCPWGDRLDLRLWFSPELDNMVKFYRLKAVGVTDAGDPTGTEVVLNDSVTWDKWVSAKREGELLGPQTVGSESNLFKVPYWSEHSYLSGQFHQKWYTSRSQFPDGKYMLIVEVFNAAGNRIKPSGAAGPGTSANFEFRIWEDDTDTRNVPFADLANVLWVDNTPVFGDIVDLRQGPVISSEECQFMSGPGADQFSIGLQAYHVHGVTTGGVNDDNSFMRSYGISWQRGLNGITGTLGFAPSGGNNHTDVGETPNTPVASGSQSFASMLSGIAFNPNGTRKCTFSVHLHVDAKHFNGRSHIDAYDYRETASFALEETGGPITP